MVDADARRRDSLAGPERLSVAVQPVQAAAQRQLHRRHPRGPHRPHVHRLGAAGRQRPVILLLRRV